MRSGVKQSDFLFFSYLVFFFLSNLNQSEMQTSPKPGNEKQNPRSLRGLNRQPCGLRPWQRLLRVGAGVCVCGSWGERGLLLGTHGPTTPAQKHPEIRAVVQSAISMETCRQMNTPVFASVKTLRSFDACHMLAPPEGSGAGREPAPGSEPVCGQSPWPWGLAVLGLA